MSVSRDLSEADIVFNRASLALARSERLIASWLPPKTPRELATRKSEGELDREESEGFSPVPELLGLGMSVPQDADRTSSRFGNSLSRQDYKLRRTLLGKNASSNQKITSTGSNPRSATTGSPRAKLNDTKPESDSEDEIGRTAFRGRVMRLDKGHPDPEIIQAAPARAALPKNDTTAKQGTSYTAAQKKRSSSYLDEVLLQRSKKRKKKQETMHSQANP